MDGRKGILQFHLATAFVAMMLAGTLLGLNLVPSVDAFPYSLTGVSYRWWGWPFNWAYQGIYFMGEEFHWDGRYLVLDLLINAAIFGLSVWGFERLYRRLGATRIMRDGKLGDC